MTEGIRSVGEVEGIRIYQDKSKAAAPKVELPGGAPGKTPLDPK